MREFRDKDPPPIEDPPEDTPDTGMPVVYIMSVLMWNPPDPTPPDVGEGSEVVQDTAGCFISTTKSAADARLNREPSLSPKSSG